MRTTSGKNPGSSRCCRFAVGLDFSFAVNVFICSTAKLQLIKAVQFGPYTTERPRLWNESVKPLCGVYKFV